MLLFYDPIYTDGIDPSARFPRERYRLLYERLKDRSEVEIRHPRLATREEITRAHSPKYVDAFLHGTLDPDAIRRIGLRPWTPSIIDRTLRITGGSLQALEHVLQHGGIAGNMAGGTHHAYYNYGSGYCIFNDIAICAITALQHPDINRVLVLDLDVHLADDTTDSDYLDVLDHTLAKLEVQNYDLILYQAGVDPLVEDALGKLSLTRSGLQQRNQRIFDLRAQHPGLPILIFMGGGYANPIDPTVDAFEDLFTGAATLFPA